MFNMHNTSGKMLSTNVGKISNLRILNRSKTMEKNWEIIEKKSKKEGNERRQKKNEISFQKRIPILKY